MGAPLQTRPAAAQLPAAAGQQRRRLRGAASVLRSVCQTNGGDAAEPCNREAQLEQQQAGRPAEQQPQQPQQPQALSMPVQTLRQLAKTATGVATAAMLALGSVAPLPAAAVLNSPIASVPRSADVALRRSIPAFNQDVRTVQSRLEVGWLLSWRLLMLRWPLQLDRGCFAPNRQSC